jgi:hypothetical protein
MTRSLDKPAQRTANEAMRRATVVEDVYVALMWRDLEDIPDLVYAVGALQVPDSDEHFVLEEEDEEVAYERRSRDDLATGPRP